MAYESAQCKAVGSAIVDLLVAVSDGLDAKDSAQGIALLTAVMSAADEFQADKDSAVLYVLSGAAEAFAKIRYSEPTNG